MKSNINYLIPNEIKYRLLTIQYLVRYDVLYHEIELEKYSIKR